MIGQVLGQRDHIWAYWSLAIFWANRAEIVMGTQESVIYCLVMRNLEYATFLLQWALGLKTQPKSWILTS